MRHLIHRRNLPNTLEFYLDILHADDESLTKLNICCHTLNNAGAFALIKALQYNSTINELTLCRIGSNGVMSLVRALEHNDIAITSMDLGRAIHNERGYTSAGNEIAAGFANILLSKLVPWKP
uniref:Uncharacterized protein n=1 Tax=Proboscia inermis TaxID=420281 RepID=A0A6T8P1P1_9STRA|mmetsp:Transcript_52823/g.53222  ORF Transcript_52823/g.53222 Transcript_52823/m.53222 type:complete len:123 (+) Transcript_52823:165-533(+)